MFSFHKPKVYRSTQGCCICKAKSSSSRFTDSAKYENDFIECFQLAAPRKGEICNACVLLVKRFKRLPPGSDRHWGHVVDARVGPGLKSMTKFKKRKEEQLQQQSQNELQNNVNVSTNHVVRSLSSVPEKFCKIFKKNKKESKLHEKENKKLLLTKYKQNHDISENMNCEDIGQEIPDMPPSPTSLSNSDDNEDTIKYHNGDIIDKHNEMNRNFIETILSVHEGKINKKYRRKSTNPIKNICKNQEKLAPVIDMTIWKKIKTCCGYVYECNVLNAVIVDYTMYKTCSSHKVNINGTKKHIITNVQKENLETCKIKISDNVNVPTTAVKKHHLYSKRQNIIDHINRHELYKTDSLTADTPSQNKDLKNIPLLFTSDPPSSHNQVIIRPLPSTSITNKSYNYLHKIKPDSGQIIKTTNTIEKIIPTKLKSTDYNLVKNFVKICTDKSKIRTNVNGEKLNGDIIVDGIANKFSDNSSDSGYEETPTEQMNPNMQPKGKITTGVRSVVLANGIKVHVQPQNLVRAVNWAGVPQNTMANLQQQTENIQFNSPSTPRDIIVVQPGNIDILPNQSASSVNVEHTTNKNSGNNLNQNIVLIKPKYLQQITN